MMRRIVFVTMLVFILSFNSVWAAFDGTPSTPQSFTQHQDYSKYDVQVHSRDRSSWTAMHAMAAQHGSDCSGPPSTHTNSSYEGAVFICNNHLMTSMHSGDGYALAVITPNKQLDLNAGSVTFDLSTERMSTRDWWDVTISPWGESLALPLHSDLSGGVDLQGDPLNAIQINSDQGGPVLTIIQNGVIQNYQNGASVPAISSGVITGTNQSATRQTFRFTTGNGHMKFERLTSATAPPLVFWDVAVTAPFASGVVQFGHHSYNPEKEGSGVGATWHWDNLLEGIVNSDLNSPLSNPFTILHTTPRAMESAGSFSWTTPAPAGSFLRFSAVCAVSVNGTLIAPQPSTNATHRPESHSSYRVAIPTGSTSASIAFSTDDWYSPGFGCQAKDAHVWSLASGQAQPTATPTLVPTSTQTPVPTATFTPTATATLTPTVTPTATMTNAPVATATSTATSTATATSTNTPTPSAVKCAIVRMQGSTELGRSALVDCP